MNCPNCGRSIPADSRVCPYCGTRVAETQLDERPAMGPTTRLNQDEPVARTAEQLEPERPMAGPARAEQPYTPSPARGFGTRQAVPIGAIWLIGIAVLAITNAWWPGILILIGMTSFVSLMNRGPINHAVSPLIFFIGMAVIAYFNWWWPGMLILIGVMMLINAGTFRGLAGR